MACLTTTCWNTIGLGIKTITPVQETNRVGIQFANTYSSASNAIFTNGRFLPLSLLTLPINKGGCGASFGPQIFNCAGGLTWKAIKTNAVKDIVMGKTWKECGITKGFWYVYVVWSPDRCAKSKGFVTTKSYAYPFFVY